MMGGSSGALLSGSASFFFLKVSMYSLVPKLTACTTHLDQCSRSSWTSTTYCDSNSAGIAYDNIKEIKIAKNIMSASNSAVCVGSNGFEGMQDLLKGRVFLYPQDFSKSESASFLSWWLWQSRRGHYLLEVVLDVVVDAPECLEHHTILAARDVIALSHVRNCEGMSFCAFSVLKKGLQAARPLSCGKTSLLCKISFLLPRSCHWLHCWSC